MGAETLPAHGVDAEIPAYLEADSKSAPTLEAESGRNASEVGANATEPLEVAGCPKGANVPGPAFDHPPSNDIPTLLVGIEQRILDAFEQKLAFDASKEKQINRLHEELQGYRSDLVAKAVRPVLQSMIRLHDDFGKVLDALEREDPAQVTPQRLFEILKGFRDDVELALGHNGVNVYRTDTDVFDPRRQKVLRKVEAIEPGQIGQLAARMRPGFEYGESILEKERVAVYAMPQAGPSDSKDKGI